MNNKNLALPISIIIAAVIIAGTIFYTKKDSNPSPAPDGTNNNQTIKGPKEINSEDHLLGNPSTENSFIFFTDLECPYCKQFHGTVKQIAEEYGKQGKIKIAMRHFPLDKIHSKSRKEAEASECAAKLGGNEKFWEYVDRLFTITPSGNNLDLLELPKIAKYIGLDKTKFEECLNSEEMAGKIQEDYEDAVISGIDGTPYFIIINKKGEKFPMSGAYPYEQVKVILNQILEVK